MIFKIKEAREKCGYSQKKLAEMIGVAPNTLHGYESGKHDPKPDLLIKIAEACHVTTDFLLGASGGEYLKKGGVLSDIENEHMKKYRDLDRHGKEIVESVLNIEFRRCAERSRAEEEKLYIMPRYLSAMSAGTGEIAADEYPEDYILKKRPPRGASYIATVHGDSMEPTIYDGDKLFIRACTEIRAGQIGVFFMDGKMWIKELGKGVLISHNEKYPPIPMTEDVLCQGQVLEVCDESYF